MNELTLLPAVIGREWVLCERSPGQGPFPTGQRRLPHLLLPRELFPVSHLGAMWLHGDLCVRGRAAVA